MNVKDVTCLKDMPLEAQREIVNDTIEQCVWDNESLTIKFKTS